MSQVEKVQSMPDNELDKWFPRDPNARKVTVDDLRKSGRTRFAHAEPSIRDLCDVFANETGWTLDQHTRKVIAAGARDFEQAIGNKPELLRQTIAYMRSKRITFSSPRSCITIARDLQASADGHTPQAYAEGEYSDFIEH